MRARLPWIAVALAGLVLAAGLGLAISRFISPPVGLSAEPVSAGQALAPVHVKASARPTAHHSRKARRHRPKRAAPAPLAPAAPARAAVPAVITPVTPPAAAGAPGPSTVVRTPVPASQPKSPSRKSDGSDQDGESDGDGASGGDEGASGGDDD